jgi:hypothetical protein
MNRSTQKPRAAPPPRRAVGIPNTEVRQYLIERGVDPAAIPPEKFRMLRPTEAMETIGIQKTKFWELVRSGVLKPVPLSGAPRAA